MLPTKNKILTGLMIGLLSLSCEQQNNSVKQVSIIPKPLKTAVGKGAFLFDASTRFIVENDEQKVIASHLAQKFEKAAGWGLSIILVPDNKGNNIVFSTQNNLKEEAYYLNIEKDRIIVNASNGKGFFYAMQSLRQLLPVYIESDTITEKIEWTVPVATIYDEPRFPWRGFMLDVSRHFFPKEYIKDVIDYLAMHKMNTLHLHLVDDQGWRIEIKKYPKLTDVGAWRADHEDKLWNSRPKNKPGEKATYGGFYTQDEIREIVAYAQSLYIKIVPEIEMPAHVTSALAAYPEHSCTGGPFIVPSGGLWPITDIYCASNDKTFEFLENVLTEVMELFPSEYIHIGGDEATKEKWEKCKKCQARIKNENLNNVEELQSYFIKRMEKFITSKGRFLIGWDEILEGGLSPEATVMSWRGFEGGIEAAKQGHDVVMTPTSHCYFDYYQGPIDYEPLAFGGNLPLQKVYEFNPVHTSMSPKEAKHVLGGQANLWTEYVPTPSHAEYMIFPRLAAMSEALWTTPEMKNWNDFTSRIETLLNRYDQLNINYAKSLFLVKMSPELDEEKKNIVVSLLNDLDGTSIYYTLDGSEPTENSKKYERPILLEESTNIKALAFFNNKRAGKVVTGSFNLHKAVMKSTGMLYPAHEKYPGNGKHCLVNGIRGSKNYADGEWQAWFGNNLEITIDLEKETDIEKVTVGTIQSAAQWIFLPTKVEVFMSNDGKTFENIGEATHSIDPMETEIRIYDFSIKTRQKARYLKVMAHNLEYCPEGHAGEGKKAWLFADEIIVE